MNTPVLNDVLIAGTRLPATRQVDGRLLVLNGAGLRSLLMLKVYVAALYVTRPARTAEAVLFSPETRAVELIIKRSIDAGTILDSFHGALRQNLRRDLYQSLSPRFDELDTAIRHIRHTREGDSLCLEFGEDGNTHIRFNGEHRATLNGEGLAAGLLSLWLGDKPVQDSLKKALLGG